MFLICSVIFQLIANANGDDTVAVKIVEEPANYRGSNAFSQQHYGSHEKVLTPRVEPIPFSGPLHLISLNGKCFSLTEYGYKYEFCPFHNVTQREQSSRWNAFHGILGVFQGWTIENNTFISMLMSEGDFCPNKMARRTDVFLKCASTPTLTSVKEPSTCHYELVLNTPLACPRDAMLVFPALSEKGKSRWLEIEEALWREEITPQGYNRDRRELFMDEGFIASEDRVVSPSDTAQAKSFSRRTRGQSKERQRFLSIEQCTKSYEELLAEVKRLREILNPFSHGETPTEEEDQKSFSYGKTHTQEDGKITQEVDQKSFSHGKTLSKRQ
ncbi:predicted protein [Nematostella vectensis]|uniref:MRH domain-containing protein n=1 Tax=Nematostella vectensis TaxID=45351 RepID=A7SE51_NEMVE|nr:predicted protein [Nematostella vectensis]|eukprot:XP_001630110.1 predicted protein [Nematostella vectensis]